MKPWGKLSKTVDKVETLLLSCFSRRKLIFKEGKNQLIFIFLACDMHFCTFPEKLTSVISKSTDQSTNFLRRFENYYPPTTINK